MSTTQFRTGTLVGQLIRSTTARQIATLLGIPLVSDVEDMLTADTIRTNLNQAGLNATQRRQARINAGAAQTFAEGRLLSANGTVQAADYGTIIRLAGYTLSGSVYQAGDAFAVLGPGSVDTGTVASGKQGVFLLNDREMATVFCTDGSTLRCVATGRVGDVISETAPSDPFVGLRWTDPSIMRTFVWYRTGISDTGQWVEENPVPASLTSVSVHSPTVGSTIATTSYSDEMLYLTPVASLAALAITLPAAANARVGQVKMFTSTQNVTGFSISALGGGVKTGNALVTLLANETYSYMCVKIVGSIATWHRTS